MDNERYRIDILLFLSVKKDYVCNISSKSFLTCKNFLLTSKKLSVESRILTSLFSVKSKYILQ